MGQTKMTRRQRYLLILGGALLAAVFMFAPSSRAPATALHFGGSPASSQGGAKYIAGSGITINPTTNAISAGIPALIFGTGVDGACNFDGSSTVLGIVPSGGVYVLTRNIYCSSITVGSTAVVDPDGWVIHDSGAYTLTTGGKIAYVASAGGAGVGGTGGGGGGARPSSGSRWLPGSLGGASGGSVGAGGNNSASSTGLPRPCAVASASTSTGAICQGGAGGLGDTGLAGGTGGATALLIDSHGSSLSDIVSAQNMRALDYSVFTTPTGGGGGRGGAGAGCGAGGGGGAGGGPVVFIAMGPGSGGGTIEAKGGDGGAAQSTSCAGCSSPTLNTCSGAGGGGGGGGFLVEIIGTGSFPASSISGGVGGAHGPGGGGSGANGGGGVLIQALTAF